MSDLPPQLAPFPDSTTVGEAGIAVGGVSLAALAAEYGTPLYVYDASTVQQRAKSVVDALTAAPAGSRAAFALKSLSTLAVLRLIRAQGMAADCASAGEVAAALRAGFEGSQLVVHGNAKSQQDMEAAIDADAGIVVVDGYDEAERLGALCVGAGRVQDILVRIAPGIDVATHRHIATGHHGSKFGLTPTAGAALVRAAPAGLHPRGLHVHLGSQVLDPEPLLAAARWLPAFAQSEGIALEVLDVGGGLGIRYLPGDVEPDPGAHTTNLVAAISQACADAGIPMPAVIVEPGRSIVGAAGVTLYTVVGVKTVGDGSIWVAVDGGMGDNMRVGLYGATYAPVIATRPTGASTGRYRIAGRYCESTDVIAEDVGLVAPVAGDVIAVPATGAYHQTMAHNYNLYGRPAAVLVSDGTATLITERETIDQLFARDL